MQIQVLLCVKNARTLFPLHYLNIHPTYKRGLQTKLRCSYFLDSAAFHVSRGDEYIDGHNHIVNILPIRRTLVVNGKI